MHRKSKQLVSVVMPAYRPGRYFMPAVESVLLQSHDSLELIIVDDGSGDEFSKIYEKCAERDSRIKIVRGGHLGSAAARNLGIRHSRGEFIATMDSDDIALPERLSIQVSYLNANPQVVCVGADHEIIDDRDRFLTALRLPKGNSEIQRVMLEGHGSLCHPATLIRAEALRSVGGYDEEFAAASDIDMLLKLGELGELENLPEVLLKYRIHGSSISGKNGQLQRKMALVACERAWRRRGIEGQFTATEPWRVDSNAETASRMYLMYGWWAFQHQNFETAMVYAWKAVRVRPFSKKVWILGGATVSRAVKRFIGLESTSRD